MHARSLNLSPASMYQPLQMQHAMQGGQENPGPTLHSMTEQPALEESELCLGAGQSRLKYTDDLYYAYPFSGFMSSLFNRGSCFPVQGFMVPLGVSCVACFWVMHIPKTLNGGRNYASKAWLRLSLMLKRQRVHSRTEQPRTSFTYSLPYVSEEHAFCIPPLTDSHIRYLLSPHLSEASADVYAYQ